MIISIGFLNKEKLKFNTLLISFILFAVLTSLMGNTLIVRNFIPLIPLSMLLLFQVFDELISKLVVTSNIHHQGVSSTYDEIFKILHNAQKKIIVVGYFVYELDEFFKKLQEIQVKSKHSIDIEFYFDATQKWKDIIVNGWPVGYSPKIFGINPKQDKGKVKKLKKIHAKMIIIDDKECLITSANLTENAMETNVEAGVWTRDKKIVEDSINFLKQLKEDGTLIPV